MPAAGHNVYCTIFDASYLSRALALHASLLRESRDAQFAFFCVDDESHALLSRLAPKRGIVLSPTQFETPALAAAKLQRSRAEYCWTCKPFALLHLAREFPAAGWLVYLDTDMLLFGDPDGALPADESAYLLTPHRFYPAFEKYAATAGRHNAGYFAMRNTPAGRQAVQWWAERCIESCSVEVSELAYGDQKYLDQMLGLFAGGRSSAHDGLNAAPWNIERYRVALAGGRVMLDGTPLLLYHFQALRVLNAGLVDLYAGNRRLAREVRSLIYWPYLAEVRRAYGRLRAELASDAPAVPSFLRTPRDWLRLGYELARGYHNLARFPVAS
jgi:hypothetical protein